MYNTGEVFDYLLCSSCGALSIERIPTDMAALYPTGYLAAGAADELGYSMSTRERIGRSLALRGPGPTARLSRRLLPSFTEVEPVADLIINGGVRTCDDPILDVGCGRDAVRLRAMARLGFTSLDGIDPFLGRPASVPGVRLAEASIHEWSGSYQLVMLNHSFEHVPDPRRVAQSIRRLLRPGGVALIRTPVIGTWFWRTYGHSWVELDAPRHLFVHSVRSLLICATAAGLAHIRTDWQSLPWELQASELIAQRLPYRSGDGLSEHWNRFTQADRQRHARTARGLNARGDAGRAAFYFRLAATTA
jgi:SAM-dependent methyltransferase